MNRVKTKLFSALKKRDYIQVRNVQTFMLAPRELQDLMIKNGGVMFARKNGIPQPHRFVHISSVEDPNAIMTFGTHPHRLIKGNDVRRHAEGLSKVSVSAYIGTHPVRTALKHVVTHAARAFAQVLDL